MQLKVVVIVAVNNDGRLADKLGYALEDVFFVGGVAKIPFQLFIQRQVRCQHEEVLDALEDIKKPLFMKRRHVTIATGKLAAPFMKQLAEIITAKFNKVTVDVVAITNEFFGEEITVSGLITGQDLIKQLKDKELGDNLLLSCNMLRSGEEVFLDDITLTELENALQVKTRIVQSDGRDFVYAIIGR